MFRFIIHFNVDLEIKFYQMNGDYCDRSWPLDKISDKKQLWRVFTKISLNSMSIYFRNIAILYIDFVDLNLGLLKGNLEKTLGVETD